MRVSWTTNTIGAIHKDVADEEEASQLCESLTKLGFTPTREEGDD